MRNCASSTTRTPSASAVEPRVSFTQIFFNPERRQHAETDAKAALVLISTAGGDDRATTMGDPTLARD